MQYFLAYVGDIERSLLIHQYYPYLSRFADYLLDFILEFYSKLLTLNIDGFRGY